MPALSSCFTALKTLDVSRNVSLTSLGSLPASLQDLDVSECGAIILEPPFPPKLKARSSPASPWIPLAADECEELDLTGTNLPREHAEACLASSSLLSLKLRDCGLAPSTSLEISSFSKLESLDVSCNPKALASGGLMNLLESLPASCTSLDLSDMGMGSQWKAVAGVNVKALVVAALAKPGLKKLRLFGNRIAECADADAVVDALCVGLPGCVLAELDLGGNDLCQAQMCRVFAALERPTALKVLELGGNKFGPESDEKLKGLAASNPGLDVARDIPERNRSDNMVVNSSVGFTQGGVVDVEGDIGKMMRAAGWKAGQREK